MKSGKIILMFFLVVHLSLCACSKRMNGRNFTESHQLYRQGFETVSVVDSREIAGCGFYCFGRTAPFTGRSIFLLNGRLQVGGSG